MDTEPRRNNVFAVANRGGDWARVERYLEAQHAPTTLYIYGTSWRKFERWCEGRGLCSLPAAAETVAMFLAGEADLGRVPSTLSRHAAAIRKAHADQGYPNPAGEDVVRGLLRGVRRVSGSGVCRKTAATDDVLARLLAPIDNSLRGRRDRAILALSFACALRRGETVALRLEDVEYGTEGVALRLPRSKTDQEGRGQRVTAGDKAGVMAAEALVGWVKAAGMTGGPLFRRMVKGGRVVDQGLTGHAIGRIVKACAAAAGFEAATIGAHSLRSGRLTQAARDGASPWDLMRISRHRSIRSLQDYVRLE